METKRSLKYDQPNRILETRPYETGLSSGVWNPTAFGRRTAKHIWTQSNELWNDNKHKKSHKDIDARWTKKNNETFFGYKNHAKVDCKSKFVNKYVVTDASVHDSQALDVLLDEKDKGQKLYADSAYTGENQEKTIAKHEMDNQVHELRSTHEYLQKTNRNE